MLLHGEPGEVDFVVDGFSGDADMDWYFNDCGPGVMVLEPKHFGSAYVPGDWEDLVFVSRRLSGACRAAQMRKSGCGQLTMTPTLLETHAEIGYH